MKKHMSTIALAVATVSVVGCSSVKVNVGNTDIRVSEKNATIISNNITEIKNDISSAISVSDTRLLSIKEINQFNISAKTIQDSIPGISEKEARKIYEAQHNYNITVVYPQIIAQQTAIIEKTIVQNILKFTQSTIRTKKIDESKIKGLKSDVNEGISKIENLSALTPSQAKKLRDWCWDTAAKYKSIPELYNPIRKFTVNIINTKINPLEWNAIKGGIDNEYNSLITEKKYDEAIAYVNKYVKDHIVKGYATKIDTSLDNVSNELIALGVKASDLDIVAEETRALIYKSANLVDLTDETKNVVNSLTEETAGFSPDLDKYRKLIKEYRETLKNYDVTDPQIDLIIKYYEENAGKLVGTLYKEATSNVKIEESIEETIGTHALNIRTLRLGDAYVLKANIEKLKNATNNPDLILKIISEVAAVDNEYLSILENELRNIVAQMVKDGKFVEAREFAWNLCASQNAEINARLRPVAFELLLKVVNPAQWAVIEKDVDSNVSKLFDEGKFFEAIEFINNYPRVKTYSSNIDDRVAKVLEEKAKLGYSKEALAKAEVHTKNEIAKSANILCEIDKVEAYQEAEDNSQSEEKDTTAFDKSLEDLYATLLKYDCTEIHAAAIIAYLRDSEQIDSYSIEQTRLLLGTMAINNRLDAKKDALIEKIDAIMIDSLVKKVKAAVDAFEFEKARNLIRDVDFFGTERDIKIYAVRIGLLNSLVNPNQYNYLKAKITADVKKFIDAGDYAGLKKYIDEYPYVHDNYQQISDCLSGISTAMVNTEWVAEKDVGVKTEVSNALVDELRTKINLLLEGRVGSWTDELPSLEAIDKALDALDASLIKHYINKPYIDTLHKETKDQISSIIYKGLENLTTLELNKKLEALLNSLVDSSLKETEKTLEEMVEISEIKEDISFDTQIAIALDAIKEQVNVKEGKSVATSALESSPMEVNNVLGEYARVIRLINQGITITAEEATSLIIGAAYLDQADVVDYAKKVGGDANGTSKRDPKARTPIMLAIEQGNANIISTLVKAGATLTAADADGNTILHYALQSGNMAMIKAVLKDADINQVNNAGESALFVAVRNNNASQIALLSSIESINLSLKNNAGATAMDIACADGCLAAVEALANENVAFGVEQLVIAAKNNQLAIAQWLVAKGVDVNGDGVMASVIAGSTTEDYLVLEGGIPVKREAEAIAPVVTPVETPEAKEAPATDKIVGTIDLTIKAE